MNAVTMERQMLTSRKRQGIHTCYNNATSSDTLLRPACQSVQGSTLVAAPTVLCISIHHVKFSCRKHNVLRVCDTNKLASHFI
jgi:hypothetical protein